jgi:hypothetical protein
MEVIKHSKKNRSLVNKITDEVFYHPETNELLVLMIENAKLLTPGVEVAFVNPNRDRSEKSITLEFFYIGKL